VSSSVPTAHKLILARTDSCFIADRHKKITKINFIKQTPQRASAIISELSMLNWSHVTENDDVQNAFDEFYAILSALLAKHCPPSTVTLTSHDTLH